MKELLSLYNAVNGTDYENAADLQIVTLENAIYMNMKNDLAFIIDCRIGLYEQQSSVNPNLPLRDLIYVVKEYQGMISNRSLYSSRFITLPTPNFVVFYNGTQKQPERKVMKLSDAYQTPVDEPALELKVLQLNIGEGYNQELKEKCPTLMQYSQYVSKVQQYVSAMSLEAAVKHAIDECIREGILAEFLLKNKAEAIAMSIFEYDEERELALFRAAEREEGREEGGEKKLIKLVCKKLQKKLDIGEIADMLEEPEEVIANICHAAQEFAPDYDCDAIYDRLHQSDD